MHKIKEMLMNELYEHEEKLKKMPNTKITTQDIDRIHKVTDTIKNIDKIEMLEDGGYSEGDDWMGEGRIYGTSYEGGSSYGRGRNAKRDSMGRYSNDGGYSQEGSYRSSYARDNRGGGYSRADGGEHMVKQLEEMMEEARTPKMREAIKRCIREVEDD